MLTPVTDTRLKIAVFIDFDNIEIGVKTTLGSHFDVGAVLEAIKERGEVVTKVAYGDWTQAGDYSRSLTQHAIHMVQRNLTPGGDKNGADINLALDALEMAFTHNHINAFVIVGGDSDFMALVEKLKQYDRKVFVVGGRAFTSMILQKNCTEFIAYENLIGRRGSGVRGRVTGEASLTNALPLIKRALKVLADREVAPQLGVLKSTLLQLDSTFSEREYGTSTFRDFMQKLAAAGHVTLKGHDRSLQVELRDGPPKPATPEAEAAPPPPPAAEAQPVAAPAPAATADQPVAAVSAERLDDGFRTIQRLLQRPGAVSRWPLYVRQIRQVLRAKDPDFDERKYGFGGIMDALRYCQREGLLRVERDRNGVMRVYPGPSFVTEGATSADGASSVPVEESIEATAVTEPVEAVEAAAEPVETIDAGAVDVVAEAPVEAAAKPKPRRRSTRVPAKNTRKTASSTSKAARSSKSTRSSRPRKEA